MSQKGALALLADYGGESSDEEVPGPRVSTKREHRDDDDDFRQEQKRFGRLPLPSIMIQKTEETIVDNPSLHEGRIRSFAHERGNWATYVYIPFEFNGSLQNLASTIINLVPNDIEMKVIQDIHISLTRTVILRHHWIDPFVNTLKHNLSYFTKFIIMLDSLNIYCNEERTRTFIGLEVKTGIDSLSKLVDCLNSCLTEFQLPTFYENPSFHLSIAWCLGDCADRLSELLSTLNSHLQNIVNQSPQEHWYIYVDHLMCKTGNKLFQFHLT